MKEKKLPIYQSLVKGQAHHAYPLSIVGVESHPWMFCNYIQLYWWERDYPGGYPQLDFFVPMKYIGENEYQMFKSMPYISYKVFNKTILLKMNNDINTFFEEMIYDGYYIYTFFDEYYFPFSKAYNAFKHIHSSLLYGFDSVRKEYFILGYNQEQKLSEQIVTYNHVNNAFFYDFTKFSSEIYLFQVKENCVYNFDVRQYKDFLVDYIESKNSYERLRVFSTLNENRFIFGINIYPYIINHYKRAIKNSTKCDLRISFMLCEHKYIISETVKYIMREKYIPEDFILVNEIEELHYLVTKILNLSIKYNLKGDSQIINKIIELINEVSKLEECFLLKLIALL